MRIASVYDGALQGRLDYIVRMQNFSEMRTGSTFNGYSRPDIIENKKRGRKCFHKAIGIKKGE